MGNGTNCRDFTCKTQLLPFRRDEEPGQAAAWSLRFHRLINVTSQLPGADHRFWKVTAKQSGSSDVITARLQAQIHCAFCDLVAADIEAECSAASDYAANDVNTPSVSGVSIAQGFGNF